MMKKWLCVVLLPLPIWAGSGSVSFPDALAPDQASSAQAKKPAVGMLFSAIVPGAGQAYAGSYSNQGGKKNDAFEAYADAHWDSTRWNLHYDQTTDPNTHQLPSTKTQQYYEMIGKYNQFWTGWDDSQGSSVKLTPNRKHYEDMRRDSNAAYKRASNCAMLVLANHVLSSLEAGWSIHKANRKIQIGLGFEPRRTALAWADCATLRVNW
jgi:hypothetical protein